MTRDLTLNALKNSVGYIVALIVAALVVAYVGAASYILSVHEGIPRLFAIGAPVVVVAVASVGFLLWRGD